MKHTIISWDCSFRNFFHLIDTLRAQDYNRSEYELIYIEQRSRQTADEFNHSLGLKSLWDRYEEERRWFNLRIIYMDNPAVVPYHLGRIINTGLKIANGELISVMDGDILVRPDFLKTLDSAHRNFKTIINIDRRYSSKPVGCNLEDWISGIIDFDLCLAECPDADRPIPKIVSNKGPLISAPREWWMNVGGYDEHRIWSTGVSRLGQDITARLEIYYDRESIALPDQFCVHPYHPAGFNRNANLEKLVLSLQKELINWAQNNSEPSHIKREKFTIDIYNKHRWVIESNINGTLSPLIKVRLRFLDILSKTKYRIV